MMRKKITTFLPCVFISLIISFWPGTPQTGEAKNKKPKHEDQAICFSWAFGVLQKSDEGRQLMPVKDKVDLKSGDKFKMLLGLQKDGYLYLIHQGPQGEISLLFPYDLKKLGTMYETGIWYFIPEWDAWFILDQNPGIETFYLLGSTRRLSGLEDLIKKYEATPIKERDPLAKQILSRIHELQWQNRQFKSVAERPVPIVGSVRGVDETSNQFIKDLASIAVEISANNFFSRTFTIVHK